MLLVFLTINYKWAYDTGKGYLNVKIGFWVWLNNDRTSIFWVICSFKFSISLFSYFSSPFLAEIVDRVALGEWPYLRPSVNPQAHSEELGQLMQRCWAEEPSDRPEFNHISVLLRKQNRSVPFCALVLVVLLTCLSQVLLYILLSSTYY